MSTCIFCWWHYSLVPLKNEASYEEKNFSHLISNTAEYIFSILPFTLTSQQKSSLGSCAVCLGFNFASAGRFWSPLTVPGFYSSFPSVFLCPHSPDKRLLTATKIQSVLSYSYYWQCGTAAATCTHHGPLLSLQTDASKSLGEYLKRWLQDIVWREDHGNSSSGYGQLPRKTLKFIHQNSSSKKK